MSANHLQRASKLLVPLLLGLMLLVVMILLLDFAGLGLEQNKAPTWRDGQIRARIAAQEVERTGRMGLMLQQEKVELLADPQIWVVGLAVLLGLSLLCLGWLALLMRRWKNQEWQANAIVDWEEPGHQGDSSYIPNAFRSARTYPRPGFSQHREIQATLAQSSFYFSDAEVEMIDYEKSPLPPVIDDDDQEYDLNPHFDEGLMVMEETGALQQAQFWAALDKPDVAIDILEQYYEQDRAPNSWLLLFELYRKTGQREKYDILRRRFKCIFNARVPGWDEKWLAHPRLTDMPELAQRINRFLSGNSILSYLESLLFDNRGGTRRGFEFGVYCDLVKLFDALCAGNEVQNCESVCQ